MSTAVSLGAGRLATGRAALWGMAAAASAAAAAVLYRFDPLQYGGIYPKCILYTLTGIYCPGCGALRAGHALLHGHLGAALGYNALFVVLLPFLAYTVAGQVLLSTTGRRLPSYQLSGAQTRAIFWLVIAFMLLRNLPVDPLSLLAP